MLEHGYTISSPGVPKGSGELIKYRWYNVIYFSGLFFFFFFGINLFTLMLLCVTQCMMWRQYMAYVNC